MAMRNEKTGMRMLSIQFDSKLWDRIETVRGESRPIVSAGETARRLMKRGLAEIEKERESQPA